MSHIPTPDSVTPEWITEQLQANGIDAEVESFTRKHWHRTNRYVFSLRVNLQR